MTDKRAFPFQHNFPAGEPAYEEGMTLRDYFAAMALPTAIKEWGIARAAMKSYQIADYMMEARKPK